MAVNVTQLAAALRLGDGVTAPVEPLLSILTRLLGVGDATVALLAPDAPDVVKDEAVINYAAQLYDKPSAPSGNRYAAAWVNSGAASLVGSWVVRRIVQDVDTDPGTDSTPVGSGISESRLNQLIDAAITLHTAIIAAHHAPGGDGEGEDDGLTPAQVNDLIADWAETGNAALIPAAKYRVPTSTTRGGPLAVTNTVIDDDSHVAPTLYAWSRSHVKRLIERVAPAGMSGVFAALGDIKPFARTGNATKPTPEDLAPGPVSGRVLGLGTSGGQLQLAWTTADHILRPGADGHLADASANQGRIGIAGNQIVRSVNQGGHDKVVTFLDYGPTRPEPPTRSAQELLYGGSVADPPHSTIGDFVVNTILWDRGSQLWIQKPSASATRWAAYSGPLGYHSGRLYQTDADAAVHVADATEIGDVYIIGHGSSQRPRIVTAYTAPTADSWQWVPLGIGIQDVADQVEAHDSASDAHASIRDAYSLADSNLMTSIAAVMTGYEAGDAALQAVIDALPTASGGAAAASIAALLTDSPHTANAVGHTVPNWRDYPSLGMVFLDTSDTTITTYYSEVNTRVLDTVGTFAVSFEKRAQLIIARAADSDVLTLTANTTGQDFVPATGDTFSFYGLNNGQGGKGDKGDPGPPGVGTAGLAIAAYSDSATYSRGSANASSRTRTGCTSTSARPHEALTMILACSLDTGSSSPRGWPTKSSAPARTAFLPERWW